MLRAPPNSRAYRTLVHAALVLVAGCAGASAGPESAPADPADAAWRALAAERPEPMDGAIRLSFGGFEILGQSPWTLDASVPMELGMSELVVTGLLRRRDVDFVERRRFAAAVAQERSGVARPPEAPRIGSSPGAELEASIALLPLGAGQATLEVRIVDPQTSAVRLARRAVLTGETDPVGVARTAVSEILAGLDELGLRPEWSDPLTAAPGTGFRPSAVPMGAVERFLAGLRAEERWEWNTARDAYRAAVAGVGGFFEAEAALARTARLRLGGTLGES